MGLPALAGPAWATWLELVIKYRSYAHIDAIIEGWTVVAKALQK
jgi:hypothetical protein